MGDDDTKWLTAKEAMVIMGMSHPAQVHHLGAKLKKRKIAGHWMFSAEAVRHHAEERNGSRPRGWGTERVVSTPSQMGELAARVFEALEKGERIRDIVKREKIPPKFARELHEEFVACDKTATDRLVVSSEQLKEIYKLPIVGRIPIRDGADLVRVLTQSIVPPGACRCGTSIAQYCDRCAPSPSERSKPRKRLA